MRKAGKKGTGGAPTLVSLHDKVLITLITTTTANFFGFFLLVLKYLFNADSIPFMNKKGEKNKKQKPKPATGS